MDLYRFLWSLVAAVIPTCLLSWLLYTVYLILDFICSSSPLSILLVLLTWGFFARFFYKLDSTPPAPYGPTSGRS